MAQLFGWRGPDLAKKAYLLIGDQLEDFKIAAPVRADNAGRRVVLWDAAKRVNGGQHLPTYKQAIGDCVANGAAQAVNYLYCNNIVFRGSNEQFRPAFRPYIYGVSRVLIGGWRNYNDGSLGIYAAQGLQKYGNLFADYEGVPEYSGQLARQWGFSGPPQNFVSYAKGFPIKTIAKVTSYTQVRDAICNHYPVTVASNVGFEGRVQQIGDKYWGARGGEWDHQMLFCGVDDDPKRPGAYLINSWGPNYYYDPGTVKDGAPPGGIWVDAEVVDLMVGPRNDDSWVFSDSVGFPGRDLDFQLI